MSKAAPNPFAQFAPPVRPATPLRQAITKAYRLPEPDCVPPLIDAAMQTPAQKKAIAATARQLIERLRANPPKGGVQSLVQEYALNSQEGVALMCLAEALLRIPDDATRDALIRDKISGGDWAAHLGGGRSLFVNAATWGLVVTGKLTASVNDTSLATALGRLIGRVGEPVIRAGVDMAMRLMGEQFVTGQTIEEALANAAKRHDKGYRFSFDMLGEAATTEDDARRYYASYEAAIHAIGKSAGEGPYAGDGISIKLSALHPRYARSQAARVMNELLPRVVKLAAIAKSYNIGFNIDAEEADRLELSLDLLESLSFDPELKNWNGLGFVVQAYGKRCPFVLDFIIDLARRSGRRIMVRLVKGAYWDSEIKRAQVDGLEGFPVYTRKIYTDVSYIACAKKLLAARDAVFPQFATHNAQSLASIYHMAGDDFRLGDYEFQCLHGMGEPLYDQVVGKSGLARPCRIYAPVGTHETLLAYLVRRLLENGANSSFVNRIADEDVSVDELLADPAEAASHISPLGAAHEAILAPRSIFGARANSKGIDLANEGALAELAKALALSAAKSWDAKPLLASKAKAAKARAVFNPSNNADQVGTVAEMSATEVSAAAKSAAVAYSAWSAKPSADRAAMLETAADLLEANMMELMGLIMREAGKSAANAIAEVREAVDFLRYYAAEARTHLQGKQGLGVITCISPWNFPLAIFLGQVSAALVAGNAVLAKPAEETPLIAYEAVKLLHQAGVPKDVLQFLPGDGAIGAALVAAPETQGVMFTGSTEVARLINATLSKRLSAEGRPIPLIAETGGQNAMIVDSSALAEQVVGDVIASAFDSAGQRCSALRVLCLQEDVADRTLDMLKGAMQELRVGNTSTLSADVGPIITAEAQTNIERHVSAMADKDHPVTRVEMDSETSQGSFVAPTLIEISSMSELQREVFGPVLHVLRFARDDLGQLIDEVNGTGYGLTFGLHTRLDETVADVTARVHAGNVYVNRNTIGAVVGVQPFGGHGLSGTGPKAGGPLYLHRLVRGAAPAMPKTEIELLGPVGERNLYKLAPRGRVLCLPQTEKGLAEQLRLIAETGNEAVVSASPKLKVPEALRLNAPWQTSGPYTAALVEAEGAALRSLLEALAALPGPVILAQSAPYDPAWLMAETSTSINTTAAGGNASLMAIG
ncbi:bifunctional proline dehydrogenase/L-glutamate gamma-semialdehyde dehydrogenase PutA [Aestuariivirga litoralis]|uniref:bifunctional proline dehydrogenase/L-glutamate gamma-semialdehyde dehydrogenase PutA n=1 Tax=Aestuariivirga litoralis TaxID=2650924 RepID=UPI0018C7617B|nr:bifunctional proline dehydrogenase/L-glutamate gamma-semialdehyde dehydrogenase PutA [Aestuariivirga litoralis]MBG1232618.1 bifunctional proline dehydrogenase/L-glutamate gamma-semialdehyde dehydrogenase PutA [Aestuariivirga litoralis]